MAGVFFSCKGHPNILGTHKNSFEFTKDLEVSRRGDCIIGVSCDFNANELVEFAQNNEKFLMTISCNGLNETIFGEVNKDFRHEHEIVVRLGDFISKRTFGIRADKSAKMLDRALIDELKQSSSQVDIRILPG